LAAPLTFIFNKSLDSGKFPDRWKLSYLSPIFKSGDKSGVKNYHPVCISSILPKLFENIVSKSLYPALSSIINDQQHGFMGKRSTATNLISFTEFVTNAVENGGQIDCIYTEFSKLRGLGVEGKLLNWLDSFHRNRKQIVKIKTSATLSSSCKLSNQNIQIINVKSEAIDVTSGCIQGGHMSGILFLAFINDIVEILPSDISGWLFADDFKFAMRVRGDADCRRLQEILTQLHCWCETNLMSLNISKCNCKIMTFTNKKNPILPIRLYT
jgi:Reverse transcriptase (RNA-dependent DNA polymerase).